MSEVEPPRPTGCTGVPCNADSAATSVLEAVSFVTPALERFLVQSVAAQLPLRADLRERCRDFVRDESKHRRMHMQLNARLMAALAVAPRGLARAEWILERAQGRLSPQNRLRLVAAFEHLTGILSKRYLMRPAPWDRSGESVKAVFDLHARDELEHRAVAFDLCVEIGAADRFGRSVALLAAVTGVALYLGVAAPSILCEKTGRGFASCLLQVLRLAGSRIREARSLSGELMHFARAGFHPRSLVQETDPT
jgi:predicted metal-dependent hydrolase